MGVTLADVRPVKALHARDFTSRGPIVMGRVCPCRLCLLREV